MPYILNFLYLLLILAALPWLVWSAIRKGKYREGYAEKLLGLVPRRTSSKKCLWLHAVSVGEVNLLAPLLRVIDRQQPDWECVISTTTKSGMDLAKKKYAGRTVFYCPLDFTWAVRRPCGGSGPTCSCWPSWNSGRTCSGPPGATVRGPRSSTAG